MRKYVLMIGSFAAMLNLEHTLDLLNLFNRLAHEYIGAGLATTSAQGQLTTRIVTARLSSPVNTRTAAARSISSSTSSSARAFCSG